jgi:uncharacterized protein YggT (Ycf19 family)
MKDDEKLAADEARRVAQHESVKGDVREKVHADISREVGDRPPAARTGTAQLAESLRDKAVREVTASETELERAKSFARFSQVADYVFYLIYGIIGLEIALEALGARESAGFKRFIDAMAAPLLAPFQGLMPDPGVGRFRFMLSYVVALVVYMLVHMAVNGLFRLLVHRKTTV